MNIIFNNPLFWKILSLGTAIPATIIVLITLLTQITAGGGYQADLSKLFRIYIVALLGWSIFFGVM